MNRVRVNLTNWRGILEQCKKEYDEWVKLLKELDREELLLDPYAIWQEAWHVASMVGKT